MAMMILSTHHKHITSHYPTTVELRLKWLNEKIGSIEAGDERIKATADEDEILNWFYDQEEILIEKFRPFLMINADSYD